MIDKETAETEIDVSSTNIMVCPTTDGRQFTVYSNHVGMNGKTAMILPVPTGGEIEPVDLTDYPTIFNDLKHSFKPVARSANKSYSLNCDSELEVQKVGSYNVSIVPCLDDFSRLNGQFKFNRELLSLLRERYPEETSYVVMLMRKGADFHPFGYISSRPENQMFIPTYHYHGKIEENPDWDHRIYVCNSNETVKSTKCMKYQTIASSGRVRWSSLPQILQKTHRIDLYRVYPFYAGNHDILVGVVG